MRFANTIRFNLKLRQISAIGHAIVRWNNLTKNIGTQKQVVAREQTLFGKLDMSSGGKRIYARWRYLRRRWMMKSSNAKSAANVAREQVAHVVLRLSN